MKGYLIDAGAREITPIDYEHGTMRKHLPGGICIGYVFRNDDVLYVDDEALLRPATVAFRIKRRHDGQPMMSNGILTGGDDNYSGTLPPTFTIAQIQGEIEWLDLADALAWFRLKAAQPAVTGRWGGKPATVYARWADLLRNLEGGDGYQPEKVVDLWRRVSE